MGDRTEVVTYRVVVDTSGVPAQLLPGGAVNTSSGTLQHPGSQVGAPPPPPPASPSAPVTPAAPGNPTPIAVRVLQRELIATANQMAKVLHSSIGTGLRQVLGGTLGANPSTTMRGILGAGGNLLGGSIGAAGRFLPGGAGMALGVAAAGAAVYAFTKSVTTMIDTLDRMSQTFSKFNAGIAMSHAMFNAAAIQANIRLANATEPVIVAFNKLKIAALDAGTGLAEILARKVGPWLEKSFTNLQNWIAWASYKLGIPAGQGILSGKTSVIGSLIPTNFTPRLSPNELFRSGIGGTLFGGRSAATNAASVAATQALIRQRSKVDLLHIIRSGDPMMAKSHLEYISQQERLLANMEQGAFKSRGGTGMNIPMTATNVPPIHFQNTGLLPPLSRDEESANLLARIGKIRASMGEQTDAATYKANAAQIKAYTIRLNQLHPNVKPPPPTPQFIADRQKLLYGWTAGGVHHQGVLAVMEQMKRNPIYTLGNKLQDEILNNKNLNIDQRAQLIGHFRQIQPRWSQLGRDIGRLDNQSRDLFREIDLYKASHTIEAIEKGKDLHRERMNKLIQSGKVTVGEADFKHVPFAALDISQTVNVKLEQKIAYESQISALMNQVRQEMAMAVGTARNEARLASMIQNTDRLGIV